MIVPQLKWAEIFQQRQNASRPFKLVTLKTILDNKQITPRCSRSGLALVGSGCAPGHQIRPLGCLMWTRAHNSSKRPEQWKPISNLVSRVTSGRMIEEVSGVKNGLLTHLAIFLTSILTEEDSIHGQDCSDLRASVRRSIPTCLTRSWRRALVASKAIRRSMSRDRARMSRKLDFPLDPSFIFKRKGNKIVCF